MAKKKDNTTSIGFEDAIWRAADKLRGNLNASEYEGVVLGLIFLKYISDKFEAKFQELSQDEYADVEDKDEYEADGVFFVPQDARWQVITMPVPSWISVVWVMWWISLRTSTCWPRAMRKTC